MFPKEYINRGQCTWTNCSVSIWSDQFHSRNLNNIPCGRVSRAYWQGNCVHVELEDGRHYVYEDFSGYSSYWKSK